MPSGDTPECAHDYRESTTDAVKDYYAGLSELASKQSQLDADHAAFSAKFAREVKKIADDEAAGHENCQAIADLDERIECDAKVTEKAKRQRKVLVESTQPESDALHARGTAIRHGLEELDESYKRALSKARESLNRCLERSTGTPDLPLHRALGGPTEILPDLVYVGSKVGGVDQYIRSGQAFHEEWGLEVKGVASLVEILQDVGSPAAPSRTRPAVIRRLRLVFHGIPEGMYLPLLPGGHALLTARAVDAALGGDVQTMKFLIGQEVVDAEVEQDGFSDLGELLDDTADYYTALDLGSPSAEVTAFVYWVVVHAGHSRKPSTTRLPRGLGETAEKQFLADLGAMLELMVVALREPAADAGADADALAALEQDVRGALGRRAGAIPRLDYRGIKGQKVDDLRKSMRSGRAAFKPGPDRVDLGRLVREARKKVARTAHIDVRACRIASNSIDLPAAIGRLFNVKPQNVTAPDWFQVFGEMRGNNVNLISLECEAQAFDRTAGKPKIQRWLDYWAGELGLNKYGIDRGGGAERIPWEEMPPRQQMVAVLRISGVLPTQRMLGKAPVVELLLDYIYDCLNRDATEAMREWVRSLWADPSAEAVDRLVQRWKGSLGKPPHYVMLLEERDGSGVVAFPASLEYSRHIRPGDQP